MPPPIPEDFLKQIDRLEPLPVTAQALLAAVTDGDVSFSRIADLIELDQPIAASVLRLSNTTEYATRATYEISTVREAVLRIGTAALLDLVLGDYLKRVRVSAPLYRLNEDELWLHGAAAQLAVRAMQQERPNANIPPAAVTAALVHDIGKLVMVRHLRVNVDVVLQRCAEKKLTFIEAERELFGTDHAIVGAAVGRKWHFPDSITDAIERHHDAVLEHPTPVIDAVITANLVAKTIGVGLGGEGLNLRIDMSCPRRLGLDFESFSRVCILTTTWLDEIRRTHGMSTNLPHIR
jgi:putative nucleotidyltransferase with HDIG domain